MKDRRLRTAVPAAAIAVFCLAAAIGAASGDTVVLEPLRDNSMYENFASNESNGAGTYLFSGRSGCCGPRRALLAFDIAGNVPPGATIDSVSLQVHVSRAPLAAGPADFSLNPMLADWGEGTSDAGDPGGFGAPPTTGDATWDYAFYDTVLWTTPGGDFGAASASTTMGDIGNYVFASTPQLVADVQGWLDAPAGNFGWMLLGDESVTNTARRLDSRENLTAAFRPQLTVDYTTGVCGDGVVQAGEDCDDSGASATCDADCTFAECGDGTLNAAAGEECDDGNTMSGDGCQADCSLPPEPIPTVSEWGLAIMALLMLCAGSAVFGARRALATPSGRVLSLGFAPLVPGWYARVLAWTAAAFAVGLGLVTAIFGAPTPTDLVGSALCASLVAYLVHLWTAPRRR